ncbi:protein RGF1 INDUCIBLE TRANSCRIPTION FACTOR 1 [Mercurialis annua]|uniref:protein RGF1 INDUCIBLE TRANSCRIPTION FACTOR 1 n=1 Tax=Mercurialis annua TaxID=3986 RepID=UPI00215E083F|nr:protein RGF1 INDUCIBLE TRANSCRIPTION FACTOR 1 [Mercurialis annua]
MNQETMLDSSNPLPYWLQVLLSEKFFNACVIHEDAKKNEKNIFCLDCCISICPHCLSPHSSHRLLQIRRYVYHDVIRMSDAHKLFDCASVQSYTTNSAKVIFINPRPQTRQFKVSGNICRTCERSLQDPYLFCSLSCKVDHVVRRKGAIGLSNFLFDCKFLSLPEPGSSEDGLMTPDTVLEPAASTRTSSSSGGCGEVECRTLACTATTEVVRKKRSSLSACRPIFPRITEISGNFMNRRKKTPNRAPLY